MSFAQLEKNDTLKSLLELYSQDVTQNGKPKDYERLLLLVKRHLEERRRKKTGMNIAKAVGKEALALSEIKALKTSVKKQ